MRIGRPYEDEIVGSILSRATRNYGLRLNQVLNILTGKPRKSHSFVITHHPGVAEACGMTPEAFRRRHTLFNYALAYMEARRKERLLGAGLDGDATSVPLGAIGQNLTRCSPPLRFCPQCVGAQVEQYGESHWRRAHQLPGVTICLDHKCTLLHTHLSLRSSVPLPPPHEVNGEPQTFGVPETVQLAIARWSVACLEVRPEQGKHTAMWFHQVARQRGYGFGKKLLDRASLVADLEAFYGHESFRQRTAVSGLRRARTGPGGCYAPAAMPVSRSRTCSSRCSSSAALGPSAVSLFIDPRVPMTSLSAQRVPTDFPRQRDAGSLPGYQAKIAVRKVGEQFVEGWTDAELCERFDACQDLVVQLAAYTRRKLSQLSTTTEELLLKVRAGVERKGWEVTSAELDWIMEKVKQEVDAAG